jgi:CheY-like chemotaxis protein
MVSVLVVDDDELIRSLLREVLTKEGYKVEIIESGVMAIKKVLKQTVDVLILDIYMGGMSGIEVIPIIKQVNPHLPIIAITGDTSPETERKVRAEGIFYYFLKPFDLEEIKKVVRSALPGKVFKEERRL